MKTKVSAIAAVDEKNGMGKNNKIPWHIKEDLIRLRGLTRDNVVILGRKTWESMLWYYDRSGKPLPAHLYIVLTRDSEYKPTRQNAVVAYSLEQAISKAKEIRNSKFKIQNSESEAFILGGGQIFKEAVEGKFVDRIYLTLVYGDFDCDTFFPDYSEYDNVISEEEGESEGHKFIYKILERS